MASEIHKRIDTLVKRHLAPSLEAGGFRRQAWVFRRPTGSAVQVVSVQGGKWNTGDTGTFTLNLGVYLPSVAPLLLWPGTATDAPKEDDCMVRRRIGLLMPERKDHWWSLSPKVDVAALGKEVEGTCRTYGLRWLETIPDLAAAGRALEEEGSMYYAAAAALADGDRTLASRRLQLGLERFPRTEILLQWGAAHGLLPATA